MGFIIGIDAGGTWIRAAVGTPDGGVLRKRAVRLDHSYAAPFGDQIASAALAVAGGGAQDIDAVSIAVAGRLDMKGGILVRSPHADVSGVSLAREVSDITGLRTVLVNDNVAAALAERRLGAGRGHENMVYIGMGTGIGGGAFVDGRLLMGKEGNAHEMGHMVIDLQGRLMCACGGAGHWEAYTSGSGLPKLAGLVSDGLPQSLMEEGKSL